MNELFHLLTLPETYISLTTLTLMEIVLGIDNVIFLTIIVGKLPKHEQPSARFIGLFFALFFRILLLLGITWVVGLVAPIFSVFGHSISGRDIILILGGLFLIAKSTTEIHAKLEPEPELNTNGSTAKYWNVITQIAMLDVVFSFDSVITAVGLVQQIPIMITAVVLSMIVMIMSANKVSDIIHKHPTIKMLALSFLLMIGTMLLVEGFHVHVNKGYIYFAMAFSVLVEMLNIRVRGKHSGVK